MSIQFHLPNQPQTWMISIGEAAKRPIENFAVAYLIRRHNLKPEIIVETILALAHINIEGRA